MFKSQHKKALFALFAASVIWGATPPIMKLTLQTVPLFSLAFLRFGGAALILLPFVSKSLTVKKKDILPIILTGIFGITYNISFFFWGLRLTTAINAGIISATVPLFTLLFAEVLLKEKISDQLTLGAILGIVGIIFIVSKDFMGHTVSISPIGDLLLLSSTIAFVIYEILSKKLFRIYSSYTVTFYMFLVGAVSFFPAFLLELSHNQSWLTNLSEGSLLGILYGIFGSSLLAYGFWNWGLSQMDAARVGFFYYLDPIVSTVVAVILLSETITPTFLIGSLLIFGGLLLAEGHLPYHHLHKPHSNL